MSSEDIREKEIELNEWWSSLDYLSKNAIASYLRDMKDVEVNVKPKIYSIPTV